MREKLDNESIPLAADQAKPLVIISNAPIQTGCAVSGASCWQTQCTPYTKILSMTIWQNAGEYCQWLYGIWSTNHEAKIEKLYINTKTNIDFFLIKAKCYDLFCLLKYVWKIYERFNLWAKLQNQSHIVLALFWEMFMATHSFFGVIGHPCMTPSLPLLWSIQIDNTPPPPPSVALMFDSRGSSQIW